MCGWRTGSTRNQSARFRNGIKKDLSLPRPSSSSTVRRGGKEGAVVSSYAEISGETFRLFSSFSLALNLALLALGRLLLWFRAVILNDPNVSVLLICSHGDQTENQRTSSSDSSSSERSSLSGSSSSSSSSSNSPSISSSTSSNCRASPVNQSMARGMSFSLMSSPSW